MSTTMKNTYSVTTKNQRTFTVEDDLDHVEAARLILNSNKEQSAFAKDLALKATDTTGKALTDKQVAWLHVLASWAIEPERSSRGPSSEKLPRVAELFRSAVDAGKRFARIELRLPNEDRLVLRHNGKGRVNITDGKPFGESVYYGAIDIASGSFFPRTEATDTVRTMLSIMDQDPATVAAQYGLKTGRCCFCGLELTNQASLLVGYGPICAEKFGLPWGQKPEFGQEIDG